MWWRDLRGGGLLGVLLRCVGGVWSLGSVGMVLGVMMQKWGGVMIFNNNNKVFRHSGFGVQIRIDAS